MYYSFKLIFYDLTEISGIDCIIIIPILFTQEKDSAELKIQNLMEDNLEFRADFRSQFQNKK